jgi:uncharacterized protein (DUF302 family)
MRLHPDYTSKDSPWTVADTVQRLTGLITERGLTVFVTIDQSDEARRVGLELRDTVLVLFGSPKAGTPVMVQEPLAALDLPLKLLVWDDGGRTLVSYLKPAVLSARYALTRSLAAPLDGIQALVDALLTDGTGHPTAAPPSAPAR